MDELNEWWAAMGLPTVPATNAEALEAIRQGHLELTTELVAYLALREGLTP